MADIELEEGEAYFLQDDDDESIDPDKDFSYIDKKIENVLGHYQKDFMGGLSVESLGARFGGYGSFLPMQRRSPPILSNQRTQNHIILNSPQNLPVEDATAAVNHSLPVKLGPESSDNSLQALSESGLPLITNQIKHQGVAECSSSSQQKSLMLHHSEQKPLKFRVKMTAESALSRDNSAIYSGLGLDISPSSSHEDSPSDYDGTPPGKPEMKTESPSCIIKIMTTFPLRNDELLSPLHDSLVCLTGKESNLEDAVPDCAQALLINSIPGNTFPLGKRVINDTKSKSKDPNKDRKLKQKELNKERKSKNKVRSVKPAELVKENHVYLANTVTLSANRRERSGSSGAEAIVIRKATVSDVDACAEEMELAPLSGKNTHCKSSIIFDKKSEVGFSEENIGNSIQSLWIARDKVKRESASISPHDAALEDVDTLGEKAAMEKYLRRESGTQKRNEFAVREDEANKFSKQQSASKDNVKEGVLNPVCPKQDIVCGKEKGTDEKILKDKEVDYVKGAGKNDIHDNFDEEMKYFNVETLESSSKQKTRLKVIPHSQAGAGLPGGNEYSSSIAKKNPRESQSDSVCTPEPPKGRLVVGVSSGRNEAVSKHNIPSKSRRGNTDLKRQFRKDNNVTSNVYPNQKQKDASAKDFAVGVFKNEIHSFTSEQKETSGSKNIGIASNIRSSMGGNLPGDNHVLEMVPVVDMPPAEAVPHDNWVQCDKCQKWRLLPLGMDVESLPKEWICSMLTWLPGKNRCSVSEEETNDAVRALYQPVVPIPQSQNNQEAYPNGGAILGASDGAQYFGLSSLATDFDAIGSGGKRRNLVKIETDATRHCGFQEHGVKKRQQRSGEISNSRNQKSVTLLAVTVRKSGDGKPSKIVKRRLADPEISAIPKKMKRVHHPQFIKNPNLVGSSTTEAKDENQFNDSGALRITQDSVKRSLKSPHMNIKNRMQNMKSAKGNEIKDTSGKKRKFKDQQENITSTQEHSGKVQQPLKNRVSRKNGGTEPWAVKKERKPKGSSTQGREFNADKGSGRTQSDGGVHNLGSSGDKSHHRRGRTDKIPLVGHHADRTSQKTVNIRKSSEKALELGLFDNATASSSSKISCKSKAKTCEVKCSPIGSTSSSPFGIAKSDPDKGSNKRSVLCNEPDGLFSSNQLKFKEAGALNAIRTHSEEMRDRTSNQYRNSGAVSNAVVEDHSARRTSAGRYSSAQRIDSQMNVGDCKDTCFKLDRIFQEGGSLTSPQHLFSGDHIAKSSNRLHFDEANSERGKSFDPQIGSVNSVLETEKGRGSNSMNVDNVDLELSREGVENHVSSRHPHPTGHVSEDIEASSSVMKNNYHWDAKTALREATNLKHSANHLKISGSRLESTEVFFQAALKFLHGASLLEPGNSETGRCREMSSAEVYSTTATLCEYCAHEYEKRNNLASAALAYKCMEVAYMRVVYCNDIAASRDRMELQRAVRTAPQVESPSSSASDIDNLNNQAVIDTLKDGHSAVDHRSHVISAGNRPNFMRLLNFAEDINRAMEASRKSLGAFAAANPILTQAGNEKGIAIIRSVIDFSFHDVHGLLNLVRLAMEALNN